MDKTGQKPAVKDLSFWGGRQTMNPKSQTLIISMKKIHEGEDVDRGLTSKGMESQFGPCGWGWYPSIS